MNLNIEPLRYPVGKYSKPAKYTKEDLKQWISTIEKFPSLLERETQTLSEKELGWRYRPEGWNIRQLVHHCADSHTNAIIRCKLALTEDNPVIKPYFEDRWAQLADVTGTPISCSVEILKGIHTKWTVLLKSLTDEQWQRKFTHPEYNREMMLWDYLAMYEWHCRHHIEHIRLALKHKF